MKPMAVAPDRMTPFVRRPIFPRVLVALLMVSAAGTAAAQSGPKPIIDAPMRGAADADDRAAQIGRVSGTVAETMGAAGYTYVRIETGGKELWAAGPAIPVAVGDAVSFERGMLMHDYHSKSLDRTFEEIYFADRLVPGREAAQAGEPSPERKAAHGNVASADGIEVSGIEKLAGGNTVAELYDDKAALVGKEVGVRGKVVKVNLSIMGKNWLHVRDGSRAADDSDDLTVTTTAEAALGDIVVVRGKLATDRDFGFGYRYDVMIEDAAVTVE